MEKSNSGAGEAGRQEVILTHFSTQKNPVRSVASPQRGEALIGNFLFSPLDVNIPF